VVRLSVVRKQNKGEADFLCSIADVGVLKTVENKFFFLLNCKRFEADLFIGIYHQRTNIIGKHLNLCNFS